MRFRIHCFCLFLLISASPAVAEARPAFFPAPRNASLHEENQIQGSEENAPPAPPNCFSAAPTGPTISSAMADGTTDVSGNAAQPSGAGCTAQVELWLIAGEGNDRTSLTDSNGNQVLVRLAVSSDVANGRFDIKLTDALLQGQRVYLKEVYADGEVLSADVYRVSQFGNWGRVKAYFTSGFLLSQDQGSFSQTSLFLAFTLDKTWAMPGGHDQKRRIPGFNTFFDTRLTAIPVTACTTSNTSGGSGSGSGSTTTNQSSACVQSTTGTGGTSTTPLDTFLASRKTARLGIGIYLPYVVSTWTYRGTPQSLFIAPLAEIGVDTPVSSIAQTQPATTSSSTTSTSGTVTPVNPTTFYNHYGYGARLGHYAMTKSNSEAPESISYLDVTVGRFSNLESFVQEGNSGPTDLRRRLYRVYLEGILKVPGTPLIIGFSANVGQEAVGLGNSHIVQRAGDDLRFLFGARFDVAKLVSKIGKVAP
jgi:hypothetical protein